MNAWELSIRSAVVFVFLLFWSRILGKKFISQMTFFDFVAGITIGTIGGSIMFTESVNLFDGFAALSVFCVLTLISGYLALKSFRARKVLNAEPALLMKQGKVLDEGMFKARLTIDDLLMMLRKKDVFYLDEVELAFFESDGTISVLKKSAHLPVTNGDLKLNAPSRGQARTLIMDGQLLTHSLKASGKDKDWVTENLKRLGVQRVEDVAFAQIDQLDQLYVDLRRDMLLH